MIRFWRLVAPVSLVVGVTAAALVALLAGPAWATAPKVQGVELIPWAKEIGADRYQSPRDWENTVKFFKKKYAGWKTIRWHPEVNLPSVKYVHIENRAEKRTYDGINLYELPGGHVHIFVLKHVDSEQKKLLPEAEGSTTADAPPD